MNEIGKLFNRCIIKPLNNTPDGGWPSACNMHFKWGSIYQDQEFGSTRQPWLWMEMDCTPLRKGWLEYLDDEYRRGGKPYMGFIGKSHTTTKKADGSVSHDLEEDPHMEGVALYPFDHKNRSVLSQAPSRKIPFDIYCRYETTRRGQTWFCYGTDLILHKWQTTDYRIDRGELKCSDNSTKDAEISSAGQVDLTNKALHHGDKGESLASLIIQYGDANGLMQAVKGGGQPQLREPEPIQTKENSVMTEWFPGVFVSSEVDLDETFGRLAAAFGYVKLPPAPEVPDPALGENTKQPSDTPAASGASEEAKDASEGIHTQPAPVSGGAQNFPSEVMIQSTLEQSSKAMRLGQLMEALKIPKSDKEPFVSYLTAKGFTADAPAFWVRKAA